MLWKVRTICLPTLGGEKFLETFYARTWNTLLLLDLLQEYGEAIVNTVCEFVPSLAFDPDLIGSWMGYTIRLDDYIPDVYKDLTDKMFVDERI